MAFRTQKISQMTPKGANLEATDLIEVSTIESGSYVTRSITGQEIIDAAVGNVDWGDIGGTLSAQTDLQNALDAKVPTSRTLTINGVTQDLSANRTFTISTGITIGSTAIASGTVGRILFEGAGNVVQESSSLFWDNTNGRLGVGTSTPAQSLDIRGGFNLYSSGVSPNGYYLEATSASTTDGTLNFQRVIGGTGTTRLIFQGMEINTNTNSGVNQLLATSGQNWAILTNGSEKMRVLTNGNVLIGTTTDAGFRLDVNGTARVQDNLLLTNGIIATSAGLTRLQSSLNYFSHQRLASSGAFGWDIRNSAGTQIAFWNYDAGSGIVNFGGTVGTPLYLSTNNTTRATITVGGNVLINTTTDAGFRLDVNGTARVQNDLTIGSNRYLKAFRWTQDDVNRALTMESNSPYNFDGVNIISLNNNLLNNTKNILNLGLASTVSTQSSSSTDAFNVLNIPVTYNFTGGTHTVKGIYYNPTLTAMVGTTHFAFHSTSGNIRFENLPTSAAGLPAGTLYNNLGVLMIA